MSATSRRRADRLLVDRGLFESRAKAQAAIEAGFVTADGTKLHKPSEPIASDAVIVAMPAHPYVSRGGVKLAAALDRFGFDPKGRICLDVGASTGGFTEVLLARGAKRIYAVDVGRGQLHSSLRCRPEIVSLEETDIRALSADCLDAPPDFITIDVSFISLKLVLPAALEIAGAATHLIVLIKPQFEAGRGQAKKGIVRDPVIHAAACNDIEALVTSLGWTSVGVVASPIAGGDGNTEFLLGAVGNGRTHARTII